MVAKVVIAGIAAAVSAVGSIAGGIAAKKQADLERRQIDESAAIARTQAIQDESAVRERVARANKAALAYAAARGIDVGSGSIRALEMSNISAGEDDILTIRANALSSQRRFGLAGEAASSRGKSAMVSGVLGAGKSLFSYASDFGRAGAADDAAAARRGGPVS